MANSSGKPSALRIALIDSKEASAPGRELWLEDGAIAQNMPGTFVHAGFKPVVAAREFGDIWLGMDPRGRPAPGPPIQGGRRRVEDLGRPRRQHA